MQNPYPPQYKEWGESSRRAFINIRNRPKWMTYEMLGLTTGLEPNQLKRFMRGQLKDLSATAADRINKYFAKQDTDVI